MASDNAVTDLTQAIDGALYYQSKELISRADWGSVRFDGAEADLDRIFSILGYLKLLPLHSLTDAAASQIHGEVNEVTTSLKQLDAFNIEQGEPPKRRDEITNNIHQRAESFYTVATPWIPFLAYQKGDVAANIDSLTAAVTNAKDIVDKAKDDASAAQTEINSIISAAREASAAAGAAVFTQDFKAESEALFASARGWLIATAILGSVTACTAFGMFYFIEHGLDNNAVLQRFGGKAAFFAILISATLWCGRIYRAQMHQGTVNKHRALSLQTFQAFSAAAADPQTKEAVLMETTKAIFGASPSGYIDSGSESKEQDIRIIDISRAASAPRIADSGSSATAG